MRGLLILLVILTVVLMLLNGSSGGITLGERGAGEGAATLSPADATRNDPDARASANADRANDALRRGSQQAD